MLARMLHWLARHLTRPDPRERRRRDWALIEAQQPALWPRLSVRMDWLIGQRRIIGDQAMFEVWLTTDAVWVLESRE